MATQSDPSTAGISRRTTLRRAGLVAGSGVLAIGTVSGTVAGDRRERYDPLPELPGQFLGPVRRGRRRIQPARYVGPADNELVHVKRGCFDKAAPKWFRVAFCSLKKKPRR